MTMIDASGRELSHALRRGEPFGLRVTGPRRCVGLWRGNLRSCPFDALIAASDNGSQCEACAWADPGRALARDATADDRDFRLYVATFGADVLKVGISALERGDERLLEQGALAFTWIGQGPHQVIRAAETAIATAGPAPERRRRATKIAGWHTRGNPEDRRAAVEKVAAAAQRLPNWPTLAERTPVAVVDHADRYGLNELPAHLDDIDSLGPDATLAGRIRSVIGTELVLDQNTGSPSTSSNRARGLIVSGRMLAGWPITPAPDLTGAGPVGYRTRPVPSSVAPEADATHPALF
ncbi:DUF2797 domain-containing protein [Nocardioides sp. NBC_00368]|uniref:DUF2797 domain-containing protein n=1 Tax=Nocardioides sp. NBC_00368 TaxID=2976000 RepID=UPI002E1DEB76